MNGNHLVIGLGGTGGKIIRALRKQVYTMHREVEPAGLPLRCLYVDSDDRMMRQEDHTWRVLGRSVQLDNDSRLIISDANLKAALENLGDYPGIKPWIGKVDEWKDILNAMQGGKIFGGQKRRLGRFLFAMSARRFVESVQKHVNAMTNGGEVRTTFHVVCGLAGGTGSGSVVDACIQLRRIFNQSHHRIFIYALLPDRYPPPGWAKQNYHANGYAALLELNAMSTGELNPHDITGTTFKAEADESVNGRLALQDPFTACYVFTNENEAGFKVDVDTTLPEIVASYLYNKIVTASEVNIESLERAEAFENADELAKPEDFPGQRHSKKSRRFFTFGIKQIAYPEEEIREYITYGFARQSLLQLRYNQWLEDGGYADAPAIKDFQEFVKNDANLNRWRLTDEHLMLAKGILPDEARNAKWLTPQAEWLSAKDTYLDHVRQTAQPERWMGEMTKLFDLRFREQYRGQGVDNFFAAKRNLRNDHVREIKNGLEAELFNDWVNGSRSLNETGRLLQALRQSLQTRSEALAPKLTRLREQAEAAVRRAGENDKEWIKIGALSEFFGKRRGLLEAKSQNLQLHYLIKTQILALDFAEQLIRDLIRELADMQGVVESCETNLQTTIDEANVLREARCRDVGLEDLSGHVVRFYEPEKIRKVARRLELDRDIQTTQTQRVRTEISSRLGSQRGFGRFRDRLPTGELLALLEQACESSVLDAHDKLLGSSDEAERLFGVSVLDKIQDRYGSDPDGLTNYIHKVVAKSEVYATFDIQEEGRDFPGSKSDKYGRRYYRESVVILPESSRSPEFADQMRQTFKSAAREGVESKVINHPTRRHEIVLLNFVSPFPLRFLKQVSHLAEEYARRTDGAERNRALLELHIENWVDSVAPSLFPPTKEELLEEALPYILLGKAAGIFEEDRDSGGKRRGLMLVERATDGTICETDTLGQDLLSCAENLDAGRAEKVRRLIEKALKGIKPKATALRQALQVDLEELRIRLGGASVEYRRFVRAVGRAAKLLDE